MKVVVVEDQVLFKELLISVVEDKLGYEVVGSAESGEDALEVIRRTRPRLLLLDILIPKLSGFHVATAVQREFPL